MKKRYIKSCVVVLLISFFVAEIIYRNNHYIKNTVDISTIQGIERIELSPVKYIELPDQTREGFGLSATGFSYSNANNCYYVGNYGKSIREDQEIHPSIICFNSSFEFIENELYFDDSSIDVQGISCGDNESIWYTNNDCIINCSIEDGRIMTSFKIDGFEKYKANGICVDPQDGSLWVLCMYKYLLHYRTNGQLIDSFECDYIGQDHVYVDIEGNIYISAGVDYVGNDNYVLRFSNDFSLKTIYRVDESYAIEGLYVNGSELIIVNDGIYHNAKIKKNYIQIYDFNEGGKNHD